jgi:hypothetical protein
MLGVIAQSNVGNVKYCHKDPYLVCLETGSSTLYRHCDFQMCKVKTSKCNRIIRQCGYVTAPGGEATQPHCVMLALIA